MDDDGPNTIGWDRSNTLHSQFKVCTPCSIKFVQLWRVIGKSFESGKTHIAFKHLFGWLHMGVSLLTFEGVYGVLGSLLLARVVGMEMKQFFMCFVIVFTQLGYSLILFLQVV